MRAKLDYTRKNVSESRLFASEIIRGAVRFSFGRGTTAADVDEAVARLAPLLARGGLSSRPAGPSPR